MLCKFGELSYLQWFNKRFQLLKIGHQSENYIYLHNALRRERFEMASWLSKNLELTLHDFVNDEFFKEIVVDNRVSIMSWYVREFQNADLEIFKSLRKTNKKCAENNAMLMVKPAVD